MASLVNSNILARAFSCFQSHKDIGKGPILDRFSYRPEDNMISIAAILCWLSEVVYSLVKRWGRVLCIFVKAGRKNSEHFLHKEMMFEEPDMVTLVQTLHDISMCQNITWYLTNMNNFMPSQSFFLKSEEGSQKYTLALCAFV